MTVSDLGPEAWVTVHPPVDGVILVVVAGELTRPVDATVIEQLMGALDQPGHLLRLDLSQLSFCDLAGLRMLISFQERAGARGVRVRVVAISEAARMLADLTGMQPFGQLGGSEDEPGPAE
ncbi:STAS domain-containing protein [Actinoplanes sp. NBC_00393]|uniref:STAS domain-containing protein n=1 Tax=Actinoplanes sp. NBC_00393 TaxID=2975953 RepID=UPI002E222E33